VQRRSGQRHPGTRGQRAYSCASWYRDRLGALAADVHVLMPGVRCCLVSCNINGVYSFIQNDALPVLPSGLTRMNFYRLSCLVRGRGLHPTLAASAALVVAPSLEQPPVFLWHVKTLHTPDGTRRARALLCLLLRVLRASWLPDALYSLLLQLLLTLARRAPRRLLFRVPRPLRCGSCQSAGTRKSAHCAPRSCCPRNPSTLLTRCYSRADALSSGCPGWSGWSDSSALHFLLPPPARACWRCAGCSCSSCCAGCCDSYCSCRCRCSRSHRCSRSPRAAAGDVADARASRAGCLRRSRGASLRPARRELEPPDRRHPPPPSAVAASPSSNMLLPCFRIFSLQAPLLSRRCPSVCC